MMENCRTVEDLLNLNPRKFDGVKLLSKEILQCFAICDAVWIHDGDLERPHAELSSGMCSNGFFDCGRVLCYPNLNEILANQLAERLMLCTAPAPDIVIGSPYAAITFSYEVAKALAALWKLPVMHGFAEKDLSDDKGKRMVWRRMTLPKGSIVLQIEELITTNITFKGVKRAVEEGNAESVKFVSDVGALVHRPAKLPVPYDEEHTVVALIEKEVWAVSPEECSLCAAGSIRYRPKTHWKELTGKA